MYDVVSYIHGFQVLYINLEEKKEKSMDMTLLLFNY